MWSGDFCLSTNLLVSSIVSVVSCLSEVVYRGASSPPLPPSITSICSWIATECLLQPVGINQHSFLRLTREAIPLVNVHMWHSAKMRACDGSESTLTSRQPFAHDQYRVYTRLLPPPPSFCWRRRRGRVRLSCVAHLHAGRSGLKPIQTVLYSHLILCWEERKVSDRFHAWDRRVTVACFLTQTALTHPLLLPHLRASVHSPRQPLTAWK